MPDKDNDAFVGYHMRGMEDSLRRIEGSLNVLRVRQGDLEWLVERLDKKVDALGTTAPEIKETIARINAETAKVKSAAAVVADVANQIAQTGVEANGTKS